MNRQHQQEGKKLRLTHGGYGCRKIQPSSTTHFNHNHVCALTHFVLQPCSLHRSRFCLLAQSVLLTRVRAEFIFKMALQRLLLHPLVFEFTLQITLTKKYRKSERKCTSIRVYINSKEKHTPIYAFSLFGPKHTIHVIVMCLYVEAILWRDYLCGWFAHTHTLTQIR